MLGDAFEHAPAPRTRARPRRRGRARRRPRPRRAVSTPSVGRAMRNEYAQTVVLCRSFWLQSTNTWPLRLAFAMSTSTRFGSRATRAAGRARARSSSCRRRSPSEPLSGTERCRPLPPDVFTTHADRAARACRAARARRGSSRRSSAGSPGSRSITIAVGRRSSAKRPLVRVQLERGEVREPHERRAAPRRGSPSCPPFASSGSDASTQFGWCDGQFFSKNRWPPRPSGARTSVGGRPARWGSITGAIRR